MSQSIHSSSCSTTVCMALTMQIPRCWSNIPSCVFSILNSIILSPLFRTSLQFWSHMLWNWDNYKESFTKESGTYIAECLLKFILAHLKGHVHRYCIFKLFHHSYKWIHQFEETPWHLTGSHTVVRFDSLWESPPRWCELQLLCELGRNCWAKDERTAL